MSDVWHALGMTAIPGLTSTYGDPVPKAEGGQRFAALLREYRARVELRQEDVADASGVSLSTVNRWERGVVVNPKPDEVRAVCRVLKLPPIKAAIALGYVDTDEWDEPEPPRTFTPTVEEVIDMFMDDDMPDDVKFAGIQYLRYLRRQQRLRAQGHSDEAEAV